MTKRFTRVYHALKRGIDLVLAVLLIPPTTAILAVIMPLGVIFLGFPVFFRQRRTGFHGKPFLLVKLRTMRPGPPDGRAYLQRARIGAYGRFVRRVHADELPQLISVVAGQMSLVGPRPLLEAHLREVDAGGKRHSVRPGLTCLAQIELARARFLDKKRQIVLDEAYVDAMSLRLDATLILETLLAAWRRLLG